jgi:hypothetical protein
MLQVFFAYIHNKLEKLVTSDKEHLTSDSAISIFEELVA